VVLHPYCIDGVLVCWHDYLWALLQRVNESADGFCEQHSQIHYWRLGGKITTYNGAIDGR
jgi:hypothetical protein